MREADNLGSSLDYWTRVYMILNSLSKIIKGFIDYYLTNYVEFELQILADELETYEKLNNFGDESSSKVQRTLEKGESSELRKAKRKRLIKNIRKCFHYNVEGIGNATAPNT